MKYCTLSSERSLVIDGYKFTKSRDGMGDRVFWRCSRRECKATAVTVSNKVEHVRSIHSHSPPVAAEFFSDTSSRSEQEVRFNNLVYTQRSRIRRRSQPNPSTKVVKHLVEKPYCFEQTKESTYPVTSYSITLGRVPDETYPSNLINMDCVNDIYDNSSEYVSPGKKRHCSDQIPSKHITLQTMSALLNKWVDSKQTVNTGNDQIETNLHSDSRSILHVNKQTTSDLSTSKNDGDYDHDDDDDDDDVNTVAAVNNNYQNSTNDENSFTQPDNDHNLDCTNLEQLAMLATSLTNISKQISEKETTTVNKIHSMSENNHESVNFIDKKSIQTSSTDDPSKIHQHDLNRSIINSSTLDVISTRHDNHNQVILLSSDQLDELLRIVSNNTLNHDNSINNDPILPKSSIINPRSLNSSESSRLSDTHYVNSLTKPTTTHYCSYYPRQKNKIIKKGDYFTPSLQHTCHCSTNQLQNTNLHSSIIANSTNFFNRTPELSTINVDETYGPVQNTAYINGNKSSSPNSLIHWKKEKIRESVEEGNINSLNGSYDYDNITLPRNEVSDELQSNVELENSWHNQPSVLKQSSNTFYDVLNRKSPCYTPISPYNNTYESFSQTIQSKDNETIHSRCTSMLNSSNSLLTSIQNDDYLLYNQIQDDILIKILNTIKHLTVKLDADANPPEVIQNCHAIQACLDTINAIKRSKSIHLNNSYRVKRQSTMCDTVTTLPFLTSSTNNNIDECDCKHRFDW
ncbi:unnamed protein product [Heterobilharzia americana]|nr:unnamed protein product [Heterobilharzia americana]